MRYIVLTIMALGLSAAGSAMVVAQQQSTGTYTTSTSTGTATSSDIRLKEGIVPLVRLSNGINIYRFRYKGDDKTVYVGVMAQEVERIDPGAVSRGTDGYLRVNYSRLGLKFMTWDEWATRGGAEFPSSH